MTVGGWTGPHLHPARSHVYGGRFQKVPNGFRASF
jgi:hypothetical protein